MMPNLIGALDDPDLFAGMFDAPTWQPWRAFLAALTASPMTDDELALYRRHTGRTEPPSAPSRYAALVCGRRGGKSRMLGLIAAWLSTVPDHSPFIVPGETPVVAVIAADRRQAQVILGYIRGTLRAVPALAAMIEDELSEAIRLTNGVLVEVHTASIGAPRGRTFLAVLCDETAFWPTGDSANPDVEVINAVRPGLSTIPYSLLLVASSPYAKRGVLYNNYARHFGKDDAPVLVWQGSTVEMNPSLVDDPLIAEMEREDPERAAAEFGAQFRSDIVAFISREAVEAVVATGMVELPPGGGIVYSAFVDPSGGSADSMTLAIAHMEQDGTAVLDCVRECRPPFSPDAIVQEFAALLKSYGVTRVTGDAYAGMWPRERFATHGITYDVSAKNKSAIYSEFLPALNGQRVRLLDQARLVGQLVTLERRTARGGRDSIDHQPGAHDDVANAVCGVLAHVIAERRPALIRGQSLLADNAGVPFPQRPDWIAGVLIVGLDGRCAVVYLTRGRLPGDPLVLLDFATPALTGSTLTDAGARLHELNIECRTMWGGGATAMWVQPALLQQCRARGIPTMPIPERFLVDLPGQALAAGSIVAAGRFKLSHLALEKSATLPLMGSLQFHAGESLDTDPLRLAVLMGISLSAEPNEVAA